MKFTGHGQTGQCGEAFFAALRLQLLEQCPRKVRAPFLAEVAPEAEQPAAWIIGESEVAAAPAGAFHEVIPRFRQIMQEASPIEIYRAPKERFVANFIGLSNFLEGQVSRLPNGNGFGVVETKNGILHCILPPAARVKDTVTIVIRPEDIVLSGPISNAPKNNLLEGKVVAALFVGEAME